MTEHEEFEKMADYKKLCQEAIRQCEKAIEVIQNNLKNADQIIAEGKELLTSSILCPNCSKSDDGEMCKKHAEAYFEWLDKKETEEERFLTEINIIDPQYNDRFRGISESEERDES